MLGLSGEIAGFWTQFGISGNYGGADCQLKPGGGYLSLGNNNFDVVGGDVSIAFAQMDALGDVQSASIWQGPNRTLGYGMHLNADATFFSAGSLVSEVPSTNDDGGVFIGGMNTREDALLVHWQPNGQDARWAQKLMAHDGTQGHGYIAIPNQDEVAFIGNGGGGVFAATFDAEGALQSSWAAQGISIRHRNAVRQATNGDWVMAVNVGSDSDAVKQVIRCDQDGNALWSQRFNLTSAGYAVYPASDNGFVSTGSIYSSEVGGDALLVWWDEDGVPLSIKSMHGGGYGSGYDVLIAANGDVVMLSVLINPYPSNVVSRWGPNGTFLWASHLSDVYVLADRIEEADNGDLIVSGYSVRYETGYGALLVRLNAQGNIENCSYVQNASVSIADVPVSTVIAADSFNVSYDIFDAVPVFPNMTNVSMNSTPQCSAQPLWQTTPMPTLPPTSTIAATSDLSTSGPSATLSDAPTSSTTRPEHMHSGTPQPTTLFTNGTVLSRSQSSLSLGVRIGIGVAVAVFALIIIAVVACVFVRKYKAKRYNTATANGHASTKASTMVPMQSYPSGPSARKGSNHSQGNDHHRRASVVP